MNDHVLEWVVKQFRAGVRSLAYRDRANWRGHFLANQIDSDLKAGRPVPLGALLISNDPLTEKEKARGLRIWNEVQRAR